jgi:hypothetical protein
VAREWGHKRMQTFLELPEQEKAMMIAYCEAKNEMSTYEEQLAERKPPKKG